MRKQKLKEKEQIKLEVRKVRSKKRYKDRIITALYESGLVQHKIKGICERNRIRNETYIHEDILHEVFYQLSRKKAEYIIEMYEDDASRLLGLAVVIAVRKGVTCLNNQKIYPKHSIAKEILFASNLNQKNSIFLNNEIECTNDQMKDRNELLEVWNDVEEQLSDRDRKFVGDLYVRKETRKRGRLNLDERENYNHLLHSIKSILQTNNYKING